MFKKGNVAGLVAEFLGTALLVTMALVLFETTAVTYFVATSVAVTLGVIVMFFWGISGAHVNPGVTFGMWTARHIGTLRAAGYIASQLLGGLAAWQLYQYLSDKNIPAHAGSFNTAMWVGEVIGTAILAAGFTAALTRGFDSLQSALTIGASLFVGMMVAAIASAGYINPALALGVRSWDSVYVLGPLVGGVIGVNLYTMLFAPGRTFRVSRKKK